MSEDRKPWEETWMVGPNGDDVGMPLEHGRVTVAFGPMAEDDARLAAAAPDLARALLAVEWSGVSGYHRVPGCPSCGSPQSSMKHDKHCELDAALRKAGIIRDIPTHSNEENNA